MEFYIGYIISGVVILVAMIISFVAQSRVYKTFNDYKNIQSSLNMTAVQLAEKMANTSNINITVCECGGTLTDNYNPKDKSINISQANFNSNSIASHAIVAHEFGHALQDENNYVPLKIRQVVVKVSNFMSALLMPLLILGVLLQFIWLMGAGSIIIYVSAGMYGLSVLLGLVTLPVEFNASSRAKKLLTEMGCTSEEEVRGTDAVLNAAAMTYVASLFVSLAFFLRFLLIILSLRDK